MQVTVKKKQRKKQQQETKKQQYVIVTETCLFKGFTTKGVRNYEQKESGKLDSDGRWRYGSTGQETYTV